MSVGLLSLYIPDPAQAEVWSSQLHSFEAAAADYDELLLGMGSGSEAEN